MAKKIMIQGTMSNSGKSFVAAALCRILRQDGYSVAPFKSQNMALNSYITKDGLEIGRAQAMQAEAAGIAPTVDMNPILLKPTSQMGSQVNVNGEVFGNLRARDYYRRKTEFIPAVREAFERLESQFDAIVLEGAGSPAEINLRDNDIVNMGMAKIANAPVLLVGDIDRGGVFASLYGTVSLLEPEERARIKGLVINKFRGDVKILEPGLRMIEERLHIPVVGVIPMEQIDLDDEDSLSDRLVRTKAQDGLDVAVIHLPHISNLEIYWHLHAGQYPWSPVTYGTDGLWSPVASGCGRILRRSRNLCGPDGSLRGPDRGLPLSGGCVFPSGCLWHSGKDAGASVQCHRPHRSGVSDRAGDR